MKNYKNYLILVSSFLLLNSCFHVLDYRKVDELTTCRNATLAEIKNNVIRAGYQIKTSSFDSFTTDWFGGDSATRISAIKSGKDVKFSVFDKYIEQKSVDTGYVKVDNYDGRSYRNINNKNNSVIVRQKQYVPVVREGPKSYYEDRLDSYINMQNRMCKGSRY